MVIEISNTVYLFIQEVNVQCVAAKELALNYLHGTITGENIFKDFEKTVIQYYLKWNLLRCVVFDGDENVLSRERY